MKWITFGWLETLQIKYIKSIHIFELIDYIPFNSITLYLSRVFHTNHTQKQKLGWSQGRGD